MAIRGRRSPGWPGTPARGATAPGAQAPTDLRTHRDPDARDELRAVSPAWATLPGQYGGAVARPADPGPALHAYDTALLPPGVSPG